MKICALAKAAAKSVDGRKRQRAAVSQTNCHLYSLQHLKDHRISRLSTVLLIGIISVVVFMTKRHGTCWPRNAIWSTVQGIVPTAHIRNLEWLTGGLDGDKQKGNADFLIWALTGSRNLHIKPLSKLIIFVWFPKIGHRFWEAYRYPWCCKKKIEKGNGRGKENEREKENEKERGKGKEKD